MAPEQPNDGEDRIAELPVSIEQRQAWVASGCGPEGETLTNEQIAGLRRCAPLRREHLEELKGLRLVPRTLTLDRELDLRQGDREIRVMRLGPVQHERRRGRVPAAREDPHGGRSNRGRVSPGR